jgi:predicted translin family RNA/ssDNA-binding protein
MLKGNLYAVHLTLGRAPNPFQYFHLTVSDYLLGLSDLTGELMRFSISGLSRKGGRRKALEVCAFVQSCKAGTLDFVYFSRVLTLE